MSATINISELRTSGVRNGLPRWLELVSAVIALIVLSPLLLLVAILVKITSRGPVLFRQQRVGRNGKNFVLYKFRSMKVGNKGPHVTIKMDSRITWFGGILRRTKLDEFPELWNIARGDMSIVGPRPEVPEFVSLDDPLWREVLQARPGVTDPVTMRLRNEAEMLAGAKDPVEYYLKNLQPEKLKGYLTYLQNRTWQSDLQVIKDTLVAVVFPFDAPPPKIDEENRHLNTGQNTENRLFSAENFGKLRVFADIGILIAAFMFSYLLRFEFAVPERLWMEALLQMVAVVSFQYFVFRISGISNFVWRYISLAEFGTFVKAGLLSAIPFIIVRLLDWDYLHALQVPLSITLMDSVYAFGGLMLIRVIRRLTFERFEKRQISASTLSANRKPTFIIGAGRAGQIAAREITGRGDSTLDVAGFFDDDSSRTGKVIQGIKVLGTVSDLPRFADDLAVENAILAISDPHQIEFERIIKTCQIAGLNLRIMTGLYKMFEDHPIDLEVSKSKSGV